METSIRNHIGTICIKFVKQNFPDEYKIISDLAKANYAGGSPNYTAETIFRQMQEVRKKQLITNVL